LVAWADNKLWRKRTCMITYTYALISKIAEIFDNAYIGLIRTNGLEVNTNEYTRVRFGPVSITFAGNTYMITNSSNLIFPVPLTSWGTINKLNLYSSSTSPEILATYDLLQPVEINPNVLYVVYKETVQIFFSQSGVMLDRPKRNITVVSNTQGRSETFTIDSLSDAVLYVTF
jgi:hypothetical protein